MLSNSMQQSVSYYVANDIPSHEIEHTINWLRSVKNDCDHKIMMLESLKKQRENSKKWRQNMNQVARMFYDETALHLDIETRVNIIKQRLDCDDKRALNIAEIVDKWAKNQRRKNRDELICFEYRSGYSAQQIAKKHNLSRQQVHNILKKDKKTNLFP